MESLEIDVGIHMFDWNERKVLITGATGFIGSWLTEALLKRGADVTALVKKDDPLIVSLRDVSDRVLYVYGDVRDRNAVDRAVVEQEIVFHLAAITQVILAIQNPTETFHVNVLGTLNILESLRMNNANQYIVFASSDKVYGEPKYLPIDEEHPLSAKSPYDASKLAADRLGYSYYRTYGIDVSIVRWSNTIGGRDANILRAAPDFITSIIDGKPPTIRGNGQHVRDYMYVTDAVSAMISVAENRNICKGEAFNFGTEKPTEVTELANMVIRLMGCQTKMKPKVLGQPTPGEIDKQYLSSKKARELIKWKPQVDLEEGLLMTIEWYKENSWWRSTMSALMAS